MLGIFLVHLVAFEPVDRFQGLTSSPFLWPSVVFMIAHHAPNTIMAMTPTGQAMKSTNNPATTPTRQSLSRNGSGGPGGGIGG